MTRSGATTAVVTTAMVGAATVVDGYGGPARFARAEADIVSRPRLLRGLLRTAGHVAELPCGAGHFLADYTAAGAETTLIDGNGAMLTAATEHAAEVGLPADRTHARCRYIQDLGDLPDVDLVVMPNAALKQLADQTPPAELLAEIRRALPCGIELLAQVACVHPGDGVDTTGFYDPARQHGVWFADRYLDPTRTDGAVLRRRRQQQHHHADEVGRVRVEFDYLDSDGASLHTSRVELRLFSAEELVAILTAAGFRHIRFLPGYGGLSEILAQTDGGDHR